MSSTHDRRYKKLFSHPLILEELIKSFVNEKFVQELDFSTLERIDKSFVTEHFKQKEADLIHKIHYRGSELYIYLLVEFQSTVNRFMALRMLRYITEFYEYLVQKKVHTLPPVFPLLLYNGDSQWTAPSRIEDLIDTSIPRNYIPSFRYYPVIENRFTDNDLAKIQNAVAAIFFTENNGPEKTLQKINELLSLLKKEAPEVIRQFQLFLHDLLGGGNEIVTIPLDTLQGVRAMFETKLKDYGEKQRLQGIQKGIQQGMRQGMQQGVDKGMHMKAKETARAMKKEGIPLSTIARVTGLTEEEIRGL